MKEKRKRRMMQPKRILKKQHPVPKKETDDDWYLDEEDVEIPEDPYDARLPALVLEMRREHEEVIAPKGWILCLLAWDFEELPEDIFVFTMKKRKENERK